MARALLISSLAVVAIAGCSTTVQPAPEQVRQDAAPRPTLTSVMVGEVPVRTLADAVAAEEMALQTLKSAASAFEEDNKGTPCYTDPVLSGVGGGELDPAGTRREEFWSYEVCGTTYDVPVVVTTQSGSGAVAFSVGTGREAR